MGYLEQKIGNMQHTCNLEISKDQSKALGFFLKKNEIKFLNDLHQLNRFLAITLLGGRNK